MKYPYVIKFIAYMLLSNHVLMSCYRPSLSDRKQHVGIYPQVGANANLAQVNNKVVCTLDHGTTICFQQIAGTCQAVLEKLGSIKVLPVICAPGYNLEAMIKLEPGVCRRYIHCIASATNPERQECIFLGDNMAIAKYLEEGSCLMQDFLPKTSSTQNVAFWLEGATLVAKEVGDSATLVASLHTWHQASPVLKKASADSAGSLFPEQVETNPLSNAKLASSAEIKALPYEQQATIPGTFASQSALEDALQPKESGLPVTTHATDVVKGALGVIAKGGDCLTLDQQADGCLDKVGENLPFGFSRRLDLPLRSDVALLRQATLAKQSSSWHKQHMHAIFPEQQHEAHQEPIQVSKLSLTRGSTFDTWHYRVKVERKKKRNDVVPRGQRGTRHKIKKEGCFASLVSGIMHGCQKAVNHSKELVSKKVARGKCVYNKVIKSADNFLRQNKNTIRLGLDLTTILALFVVYPCSGIALLHGDVTVLFGEHGFGSAMAGWGANLAIVNFSECLLRGQLKDKLRNRLFWQKCHDLPRGRATTVSSMPSQEAVAQTAAASSDNAMAPSLSAGGSRLANTMAIAATKDGQDLTHGRGDEKGHVDTDAKGGDSQVEEGEEEAIVEGLRLEKLEEVEVVIAKYLEKFRATEPSQQGALCKSGKKMLSLVESLKKITKEQYRNIGRIFILSDVDPCSWPLLLAQAKDLKCKYLNFKKLRNELQVALKLSEAESRSCGLRMQHNAATEEEEFYSSDEEQNYSDQSARIKQAFGAGIASVLKQHMQLMLPSLLRLVLRRVGPIQNYIDLIQSVPELPEIFKEYYNKFHELGEEESAEALGQLLIEVVLALVPTHKLRITKLVVLKQKLGKAAAKVAKKGHKMKKDSV